MEEQRRFSRGRFLRLSAMTAGGVMLAGCNLEEGGGPPGGGSGGSEGEDVDISKIQAPGQILNTIPESDLFTQKGTAMVWTDFTYIQDFEAAGIDFGIIPSPVHTGSVSFVDTWTTAWGTFVESDHHHAALTFLQFMGTEAQRIRARVSVDPPLSLKVANEINWGAGDQTKEEYLTVLEAGAKPQVFVPPLPEGAWDQAEVYNEMTVQGETDAEPLLDAAAKKTQPLLDQAWKDWDALARG